MKKEKDKVSVGIDGMDYVSVEPKHMFKALKPCLKGYALPSVLSLITVIGEGVFEIYIPFIMASLIDVGIPAAQGGDMSIIFMKGGMMILFAFISLALGVLCARFASVASTGFAKNVRSKLFSKVESFSFSNMDKFSTASLVTRLTNDVTNVQNSFQMIIRICARAPIMLIAATIMAIRLNAGLSSMFIIVLPVLALSIGIISVLAFPKFRKMLIKYDSMNAGVQENLTGIRIVKSFVRGNYERKKFNSISDDVMNSSRAAEKLIVITNPIMQFMLYACLITVCAVGGNLIIAGSMTEGQFMSFISYIAQILMSVMMISMIFVNLVLTRASISRIVEVINEESSVTDENADAGLTPADGSVEFKNVSFGYGDGSVSVLSDISFKISSGETVGIIGGTGSAKTSLVQLIPRLYDVTGGSVLVGGHDVRDYKLRSLRNSVSMVLQKNVLFSGTIAQNLRWGNTEATDDELVRAAKAAQAHDFIMSFPDGYDTDLSQGGINLSGGQKQRMCIARALLKKPDIIVLDDSTSAVDTATDSRIREALSNELSHITVIIIAQRIASVMNADKIIVMSDGRITDIGTHEELLKSSKIYGEVASSQLERAAG